MIEENAKGAFIEKMLFALLPLIIAGVGYLLSAVGTLAHQVTILESKMSLAEPKPLTYPYIYYIINHSSLQLLGTA
jgi:hypothetical protein